MYRCIVDYIQLKKTKTFLVYCKLEGTTLYSASRHCTVFVRSQLLLLLLHLLFNVYKASSFCLYNIFGIYKEANNLLNVRKNGELFHYNQDFFNEIYFVKMYLHSLSEIVHDAGIFGSNVSEAGSFINLSCNFTDIRKYTFLLMKNEACRAVDLDLAKYVKYSNDAMYLQYYTPKTFIGKKTFACALKSNKLKSCHTVYVGSK